MPRGNPDNLIKNSDLTPEQRIEKARAAGVASGKARAEKRTMRQVLEELLEKPIKDPTDGKEKPRIEVIMAKMLQKASEGNIKAAEFVRDTSGQKPDQTISIKDIKTIPFEINDND